jgi:cytochrome c553
MRRSSTIALRRLATGLSAGLLLVGACTSAMAQDRDPELARNVAAGCANCHGTNGVSLGGIPSLAGQDKSTIVRKMQDFKGARVPSTIMNQLAKGYTDEQIELAASWYAAQRVR